MKVYEAVANALKECGGQNMFGLMGDGNLRLLNYWVNTLEQGYYGSRHESGGIAMADGYVRVSGQIGLATTTQGPGLTNALTALVAARKARSPMVYVVGDVASFQAGWPQDIDHQAVFDAAGVPLIDLRDPAIAFSETVRAVRLAWEHRGPVGLSIPTDVQEMDWDPWTDDSSTDIPERDMSLTGDIDGAAEILASGQRPVIIAGRGTVESGCYPQLLEIGDRIGALFATTLKGKGMFEESPFALGMAGGLGTNLSATLIGQADVVLVVGAALNDFTTIRQTLLRSSARVVRCDLDPDVSTANVAEDCRLIGDAATAVSELLSRLEKNGVSSTGYRTDEVEDQLRSFRPQDEVMLVHEPGLIDPRELVMLLDDLVPKYRNLATDSGRFFGDPCSYMSVPDGRSFVDGISFGSIGLGMGLAMGTSVAQPDRPTVLYVGDGGLFMSLGELETAVRYKLPLLVVVMNDNAYGSELQISRVWGLPDTLSVFRQGDFAAIAAGIGARSANASSLDEVRAAVTDLDLTDGPFVLDCTINPNISARWLDDAFERA
ncbi:MAG: thiamine pyrophosphate-binding protein [Microthrixaceae bacterium]